MVPERRHSGSGERPPAYARQSRPAAGIRHALTQCVADQGGNKPYIDVMENVFGGVKISTEVEAPEPARDSDIRPRPWLSGLTVSASDVRLIADEEPKKPPR